MCMNSECAAIISVNLLSLISLIHSILFHLSFAIPRIFIIQTFLIFRIENGVHVLCWFSHRQYNSALASQHCWWPRQYLLLLCITFFSYIHPSIRPSNNGSSSNRSSFLAFFLLCVHSFWWCCYCCRCHCHFISTRDYNKSSQTIINIVMIALFTLVLRCASVIWPCIWSLCRTHFPTASKASKAAAVEWTSKYHHIVCCIRFSGGYLDGKNSNAHCSRSEMILSQLLQWIFDIKWKVARMPRIGLWSIMP